MKLKIEGDMKGFSFVLEEMPETTTELLALVGYLDNVKLMILQKVREETDSYLVSSGKDEL